MSADRRAPSVEHDAIVLAGGRGERLGGRDKALVEVGGRPLLARVLDATAGARSVVVVGSPRPGFDGVHWASEEPPGGGPTAGIVAGLRALGDGAGPWVLVLAVDQPGTAAVVPAMLQAAAAAAPDVDALCPHDSAGHPQWLLAAYRRDALVAACAAVGSGHGVSVRRLVAELRIIDVPVAGENVGDVDTWDDHRAWQDRLQP
ncbi:MAG: molybdenum cofactor guanylyltransferase [Ornithinimicrobium sp.]|uniref:molybdenum cofactor guanylyltransferase n=1 Tax=Ornithinimicrobium sp. TaxID=1977084 RepID=UPI003D9AC090